MGEQIFDQERVEPSFGREVRTAEAEINFDKLNPEFGGEQNGFNEFSDKYAGSVDFISQTGKAARDKIMAAVLAVTVVAGGVALQAEGIDLGKALRSEPAKTASGVPEYNKYGERKVDYENPQEVEDQYTDAMHQKMIDKRLQQDGITPDTHGVEITIDKNGEVQR